MLCFGSLLLLVAATGVQADSDPVVRDPTAFDSRRPPERERALSVSDDFSLALVGDMIISRPLSRAPHVAGFDDLLTAIRDSDAAFGNLETTLIDLRRFGGYPYPFDGDWANVGTPAVAADLAAMGFDLVGRANNHSLDWGLEGMRETDRLLDQAGIVHAGTGETEPLARAPAYFESPRGRVALVSFATTFRPTSEAMTSHESAPGRPGLSAIHLGLKVHVVPQVMKSLSAADCAMHQRNCSGTPASLTLGATEYVADNRNYNEYEVSPNDIARVDYAIREARQHADFVLVAVHSHQCDWDCDMRKDPQLPARALQVLARRAIDAGADVFAATGIHNLGPIEIYHGRPVLYGLSNFFWSDIQEPVPQELFDLNAALLRRTYEHPERATDYDLTAPLNAQSFANELTFQSVMVRAVFARGKLAKLMLYPVSLGYGENLRTSGTPRLETRPEQVRAIFSAIEARTRTYGLPPLRIRQDGAVGIVTLPGSRVSQNHMSLTHRPSRGRSSNSSSPSK
jgi:poly-gamma-glutamate capsule biosynthesis protein CapA/YwtB (metallophosphatase superfamily)